MKQHCSAITLALGLVTLLSAERAVDSELRMLDGRMLKASITVSKEDPDRAARVCISNRTAKSCREAVSGATSFGYDPKLVTLTGRTTMPSLFAFSAKAEPDGSHQLEYLDVVAIGENGKPVSMLSSAIILSEQSQHSSW